MDKLNFKRKIRPLTIVLFIILALYTLTLILLFIWSILTSLKDDLDFGLNTYGLPEVWTFSNYIRAFEVFSVTVPAKDGQRAYEVYMLEMYGNSALYCFGCALVASFVPCLTAYCCTRFPNPFSKAISVIVIFVMIMPIVGAEPSNIRLARSLLIYDTIWGMWIMAASFTGMYFLVFEAIFRGLSKDYSEAAEIDGANEFTIFFRIALPLVRNTFFTIFLILLIQRWNDYSSASIYMPSHPTIANGVFRFHTSLGADTSSIPMKVTGALLVFIPMLIVFALFNGRLMGNLTMGGVKE